MDHIFEYGMTVVRFVNENIMTIEILEIPLLSWIIGFLMTSVMTAAVISFAHITPKIPEKKNKE